MLLRMPACAGRGIAAGGTAPVRDVMNLPSSPGSKIGQWARTLRASMEECRYMDRTGEVRGELRAHIGVEQRAEPVRAPSPEHHAAGLMRCDDALDGRCDGPHGNFPADQRHGPPSCGIDGPKRLFGSIQDVAT